MANVMAVIREDDTQGPRHGGLRQYRHFKVYVNGVVVEEFADDSARHGYDSDKHLDNRIQCFIQRWELALGCKCIRGERKGRIRLIQSRGRKH